MSDTENLNEAEVEENDLDANQAEADETEELADDELFSDLDEDLDEFTFLEARTRHLPLRTEW